jgi:hypothetical protein
MNATAVRPFVDEAAPTEETTLAAEGEVAYLELLRQDVESAGKASARLRLGLNAGFAGLVVACAPGLLSFAYAVAGSYHPTEVAYMMATEVVMALLAGNGLSVAFTAGYRRRLQQRLREKLQRFAREQQADVLLPLRATPTNDTRKIVEPLLRELRAGSTEVAPAAAPVVRSRRW